MPYPTIDFKTKKVILLSGYQWSDETDEEVKVVAIEKLQTEMERHADAVAFSYVSGKWRASA